MILLLAVCQVAGRVYTHNPGNLENYQPQGADFRDDLAQGHTLRCLDALAEDTQQVLMAISNLKFREYMDHKTGAVHTAASLLPNVDKLPEALCDGECDVLILHPVHGIIIGEIKSVGGDPSFASYSAQEQQQKTVSIKQCV